MKKAIKKILLLSIRLLSSIYSYELYRKFVFVYSFIYSNWVKNSIKSCGKNFLLESPFFLTGGKYMSIGDNFSCLDRARIECLDTYFNERFSPELSIGHNVIINKNFHLGCINKIVIGNNVLFASNIYITDHHHGYSDERDATIPPAKRKLISKGGVFIEDDVWVGENVVIMPNVTIGKGCVIGANSVVTKSFPEYCVIAGAPARLLRDFKGYI